MDSRTEIVVDEAEARQRLDRVLATALPALSRSRLKALIEAGQVTLNGDTMADANKRVNAGDRLELTIPPPEDPEPQGEAIALDVVFEDEHLIVINKPRGLVVHPAAGNWTGTLVNGLIHHCGDSLSGIGGIRRPGIVHRLDKDTTGLMVVAKTDVAHQGLAAQFADHGRTGPLRRAYQALIWGRPPREHFTIDAPIERDSRARDKMAVRAHGREAITHVSVLESFPAAQPLVSLVECRLETGRTHQIRVHLAHQQHPLLGDDTYGSGFKTKAMKLPEVTRKALHQLNRQALHAIELGFAHPASGEEMLFRAELPDDFLAVLRALDPLA